MSGYLKQILNSTKKFSDLITVFSLIDILNEKEFLYTFEFLGCSNPVAHDVIF